MAIANYKKIGFNNGTSNDTVALTQNNPTVSGNDLTVNFVTKPNASYYIIKYGASSGNYPFTTYSQRSPITIKNLAMGNYYVSVSAVCAGVETPLSNEKLANIASANIISDDLTDFSKIYSRTPNLIFDVSNNLNFGGDTSRLTKNTTGVQSIIYNTTSSMTSFEADTYFWTNEPIDNCNFYTSIDNVTYSQLLPNITNLGGNWTKILYSSSSLPVGTKFLKIELRNTTGNSWNPQISKVTIEGVQISERDINFDNYIISANKEISNIQPGSTVNECLANLQPSISTDVTFKNYSGDVIIGSSKLGTGSTIDVAIDGVTTKYTVIIYGDLNGDSNINVIDLLKIKWHLLKIKELSGAFFKAGTIELNDVSITGLVLIKKHILGISLLNQNF